MGRTPTCESHCFNMGIFPSPGPKPRRPILESIVSLSLKDEVWKPPALPTLAGRRRLLTLLRKDDESGLAGLVDEDGSAERRFWERSVGVHMTGGRARGCYPSN